MTRTLRTDIHYIVKSFIMEQRRQTILETGYKGDNYMPTAAVLEKADKLADEATDSILRETKWRVDGALQ